MQARQELTSGHFPLLHLARRFFAVVLARPLDAGEQAWVADWLPEPPLLQLFWASPRADRRHAHDVARFVADRSPLRGDLIRAALLHDVGKRHAGLGPVGRSVATLLLLLGMRGSERTQRYHRHGVIGADELRAAGVSGIEVAYAESHHETRPNGVEAEDWRLLVEADRRR